MQQIYENKPFFMVEKTKFKMTNSLKILNMYVYI